MGKREGYLAQIRDWGYCYCGDCGRIRYSFELEATEDGIRCSKCGGYNLEAPAWTICPYERGGAVKCARAGKGLITEKYGMECKYRCTFREP